MPKCKDGRRRQDCKFCNEAVLDIPEHLKSCAQAPTKERGHCKGNVNKFVFGDHLKIYCTAAKVNRQCASAAQAGMETAKEPGDGVADSEHKGAS